ncbi:MAG: OmpH family outer membrane protein, partial [Pseudomonadota bacterium]
LMFKKVLLAAMLMMVSSVSLAGKVVVFDAREALLRTKVAQERFTKVRELPEVAALIKDADRMRRDLLAMNERANKNAVTWSDEEKASHVKRMEYVQADLQLATQKIQAEQNLVINELVEELREKIEVLLGQYVEDNDIDLVLRKETSFLAKPVADITQAIVVELDKEQ